MASDFFNSPYSDPVGELPSDKLERAMAFRNGLVALCEGRSNMNDSVYRLLRREFMEDASIAPLLPPFVRSTHDTAAMWGFLKGHSGQWEPRRQFVREQFAPLIDRLERTPAPADAIVSDALQKFDADAITDAWNKALSRREADPAGAITAARTLLESVCKHLLEDAEGSPTYGPNDDLPKLYRQAAELLNIAPSQHSEDAFKRILGSAASIVEGIKRAAFAGGIDHIQNVGFLDRADIAWSVRHDQLAHQDTLRFAPALVARLGVAADEIGDRRLYIGDRSAASRLWVHAVIDEPQYLDCFLSRLC